MSTPIYVVTQPDTSYTTDNSIFEVQSGASLDLAGNSNEVFLDSGAGFGTIYGIGNTVLGASASANLHVYGDGDTVNVGAGSTIGIASYGADGNLVNPWYSPTASLVGNTVSVGAGSVVTDTGCKDTITVGANSKVYLEGGNFTVNGTQGDDWIAELNVGFFHLTTNTTINANNATIQVEEGNSTVTGYGNQIYFNANSEGNGGAVASLNLSGNNNTMSFSANTGMINIQTADGDQIVEDASGAISYSVASPARLSIINGIVNFMFSDGNVVHISDVKFTDTQGLVADNQANQLVSAMASYSVGPGGVSSTLTSQVPTESPLVASVHH